MSVVMTADQNIYSFLYFFYFNRGQEQQEYLAKKCLKVLRGQGGILNINTNFENTYFKKSHKG